MIYCILVSHKAMQMQEEGAHTFPTYKALLNAVVAELYDHNGFMLHLCRKTGKTN